MTYHYIWLALELWIWRLLHVHVPEHRWFIGIMMTIVILIQLIVLIDTWYMGEIRNRRLSDSTRDLEADLTQEDLDFPHRHLHLEQ